MKSVYLLWLVLLLISIQSCNNSQPDLSSDYYWYKNTQIQLERGDQEYIIYDDALLLKADKEQLIESGDVSYLEGDNLKWGITNPNAVIKDLEHVLYRTPSYKRDDGGNMFVTHRFYVKLKDSNDISVLQDMAKQYNSEIEENDAELSLWYILRCGLRSSLNALNLANIFYESGLFSVAEPEFMGTINSDSLDYYTGNIVGVIGCSDYFDNYHKGVYVVTSKKDSILIFDKFDDVVDVEYGCYCITPVKVPYKFTYEIIDSTSTNFINYREPVTIDILPTFIDFERFNQAIIVSLSKK